MRATISCFLYVTLSDIKKARDCRERVREGERESVYREGERYRSLSLYTPAVRLPMGYRSLLDQLSRSYIVDHLYRSLFLYTLSLSLSL